jgi:sigma-B regulation protein RsbU (phosphoserine phosphatase)
MSRGPEVTVHKDYLENLERKVGDLETLIEVSSIISSTLDFNELITLVMEKAKNVMDAEACSILLYNKETNRLEFEVALSPDEPVSEILKEKISLEVGQGIVGWAAEHMKPLVVRDAQMDSRFNKEVDKSTGFTTKSLIAAPLIGRSGLIGVAEILNSRNKEAFDDYDADIFQTHCRQVAVAIENAKFHKDSLEQEKFRRELEIASEVQRSFLPERPSLESKNIKINAANISASHVGGDVYDFIEHKSGRIGVLIGDVSGKGVSAALYMAKIISEFRNVAHMADTPEDCLERLNSKLTSAPRGMFLTCVYLMADPVTGVMSVSVAGHPPFLKTSQGKAEVITLPSGPPVGILQTDFPVTDIKLLKGESILLLTDGVFDAKNIEGERIGFEKITEFVNANAGEENLIHMLIEYVNRFSKDTERADDLTLVGIRMKYQGQ